MSDVTALNSCMSVPQRQHEAELSRFLTSKIDDGEETTDLLRELLLRTRVHSDNFCEMENPRAWLYRAAKNLLIDEYHTTREFVELENNASLADVPPDAISTLDVCLPETLQVLPEDERWSIEEPNLSRRPQQSLTDKLGITLMVFRSRLLRARKHPKETMAGFCQIEADDTSPVYCRKKIN